MSATDEVIDPDALPDPPLYLAAEIRRLELGAAAAGLALMERAGAAAAQLIDSLIPDEDPVLFLAGPGNNGGDAWVAARLLHAQGRAVTLVCRADPAKLPQVLGVALPGQGYELVSVDAVTHAKPGAEELAAQQGTLNQILGQAYEQAYVDSLKKEYGVKIFYKPGDNTSG